MTMQKQYLSGCWDGFDNNLDTDSESSSATVVGYGEVKEVCDRIDKMTAGDIAAKSSIEAVGIRESVRSTKGTIVLFFCKIWPFLLKH